MRNLRNPQLERGEVRIEDIELDIKCKILEDLTKIPGTLGQDSWNTWPRFLEHLAKIPGTLGQGSWRT